jgi:transcriptional regulator with XRE-family HTH domain
MGRPSDPVLKWLRSLIESRGLNTAALAEKSKIPRQRLRRILAGGDAMLVDELMQVSNALQISPADMGLHGPDLPEGDGEAPVPTFEPDTLPLPDEPAATGLDPWGNHVEQLFRAGFTLGCDFHFAADPAELEGSGVPEAVLRGYQGRGLPIEMKAEYHPYNNPRYDADGITLTLSFDGLHECRFPWTSIRHVLFLPQVDAGDAKPGGDPKGRPGKPHLRLVD